MATSKARAALDSWLADAEQLLADQRSRSVSPSSHSGSWAADEHQSTQTVREVVAGLECLLGQLVAAPGRWIFVIEDARMPVHYIQFLCYEDGSLLAEVVSNYFLDQLQDTRPRWDETQEKKLAALGWQPPAPTWILNWTDIWPVYDPPVDVVAARARRTLPEVFELSGDDAVVVKMFSSPNRGGTPASEFVEDPPEGVSATKTRGASMTSSSDRRRRDARECPQCGAMGILPLHQEPGDDAVAGTIENPVMICPVCEGEFRATGMTWMGAVSLADMTDAELDELTEVLIARMGEVARRHGLP